MKQPCQNSPLILAASPAARSVCFVRAHSCASCTLAPGLLAVGCQLIWKIYDSLLGAESKEPWQCHETRTKYLEISALGLVEVRHPWHYKCHPWSRILVLFTLLNGIFTLGVAKGAPNIAAGDIPARRRRCSAPHCPTCVWLVDDWCV